MRELPPRVEVCLDWYDGPIRTGRRVEFEDSSILVEVSGYPSRDPKPDHRGTWVSIRLDEEELLQLLAIVRGQPIEDYIKRKEIDPKEPEEVSGG